jgi:hypothetical protein
MKIVNVMTDRIYIKYKEIGNLNTKQYIYCLEPLGEGYSSVSGYIEGTTELLSMEDKVKVISILNDFKDNYKEIIYSNKKLNTNLEEVMQVLTKYNYDYDFKDLDILKIDLSNEAFLSIFEDSEELLKFLDEYCSLFNIKNVDFIYKNKNNISKLNNYIGSYLNFNLVKKSNDYGKHLTIDLRKFYELYYILIRNKCLTETYITINIKNKIKYNIKVKIGSNLNEVLKILDIDYSNSKIIVNEKKLYEINDYNYLISKDVSEIILK